MSLNFLLQFFLLLELLVEVRNRFRGERFGGFNKSLLLRSASLRIAFCVAVILLEVLLSGGRYKVILGRSWSCRRWLRLLHRHRSLCRVLLISFVLPNGVGLIFHHSATERTAGCVSHASNNNAGRVGWSLIGQVAFRLSRPVC
jgi:hypothetical protein